MKQLCSNCVHCGKILTDGSWPYYCETKREEVNIHYGFHCPYWHHDGSTDELHGPQIEYTILDEVANNEPSTMRQFDTGATRDSANNKPDYAGYLCPLVLQRYGQYMLKHQVQADGKIRASDNWQKGIPKKVYMSSLFRHFMDVWLEQSGYKSREGLQESLCGMMFNVMGILHEELKQNN